MCKVTGLVLSLVATQGSFAAGQKGQGSQNNNSNQVSQRVSALDPKVRAVQLNLADEGLYKGPIDGVYSRSTRDAVARYQAANKLPVTGKITVQTLKSLGLLIDSAL